MGERLSALIFKSGLTVRELKEFIKDWPEIDSNGNPTEVWVEIGEGVSAPALEVWPLNCKREKEGEFADILFGPGTHISPETY